MRAVTPGIASDRRTRLECQPMNSPCRHFRLTARIRLWVGAVATAALLLLAAPALALGLGQLQVKSRPGQPFLAEIPIVASDPTELQGLQARLASPETFQRIGLPLPRGAASNLRFTLAVDAQGKPVIQVRSDQPVNEPTLRFLVEVDWGQGRLVREYSALIDAPGSIAAQGPPPVSAPQAGQLSTIAREPRAPPAAPAVPGDEEVAAAQPATEPADAPPPATEQPSAVARAPAASPSAALTPAERTTAGRHHVKRGETLSQIAASIGGADGFTLNQTMLALLRSNPDAFIGEDINRLRAGAILQMPGRDELARYDAAQAAVIVRDQVARWRQARRALAQPVADAAPAGASAPAATAAAGSKTRARGARLEIAPPGAEAGAEAGVHSGMSAGGDGQMQRQQLQQARETLAAREAEVKELQERVADLERLQKEQAQLLSMKDDALAAAERKLAQANTAAATVAPPTPARLDLDGIPAWGWLLPAALALVLLTAWWLRRRRRRSPTLSSLMATAPGVMATGSNDGASGVTPPPAWADDDVPTSVLEPAVSVAEVADDRVPAWVGEPAQPPSPEPRLPESASSAVDESRPTAVHGMERIEFAQAYLDMGDKITAHSLLTEVVDSGDPQARERAQALLRTIH